MCAGHTAVGGTRRPARGGWHCAEKGGGFCRPFGKASRTLGKQQLGSTGCLKGALDGLLCARPLQCCACHARCHGACHAPHSMRSPVGLNHRLPFVSLRRVSCAGARPPQDGESHHRYRDLWQHRGAAGLLCAPEHPGRPRVHGVSAMQGSAGQPHSV